NSCPGAAVTEPKVRGSNPLGRARFLLGYWDCGCFDLRCGDRRSTACVRGFMRYARPSLISWRHSWRRLCPACGDRGWVAVITNHVDALLARAPGSAGVVGDEPGGRACGGVEGV